MKKRILAIALALAMLFALAACGGGSGGSGGGSESPAPSESSGGGSETPATLEEQTQNVVETATADEVDTLIAKHTNADGKTYIRVGTSVKCSSFEPWNAINNTKIYGKPVYEALFSYEGVGGEWVPVMAESAEQVDDLIWEVKLKDYIYDSAGNHITASDVVYSYMVLGKEVYKNRYFNYLEDIEIVDDYTMIFHMNSSSIISFKRMAACYVWSQKAYEDSGDNMASHPVGTGPYVLKEWISGTKTVYEKRDDYWETDPSKLASTSKHNVDVIEFVTIADEAQMVIALQTDVIDVCEELTGSNVDYFEDDPNFNIYQEVNNKINVLTFNCDPNNSPCGDLYLRQAITYAIDRQAIIDIVYGGEGVEAKGPHTYNLPDFNPEWANNEYYAYNLDKAKECLEKSSYDGTPLRLMVEPESEAVATVILNCLTAIGVNVELNVFDTALYNSYQKDGTKFDMQTCLVGASDYALSSWGQHLNTSSAANSMGIEDPALYELLMTATETVAVEDVDALYNYITDNCMYIGLVNSIKSFVTTKAVDDCVSCYAQYYLPSGSGYVWNR